MTYKNICTTTFIAEYFEHFVNPLLGLFLKRSKKGAILKGKVVLASAVLRPMPNSHPYFQSKENCFSYKYIVGSRGSSQLGGSLLGIASSAN